MLNLLFLSLIACGEDTKLEDTAAVEDTSVEQNDTEDTDTNDTNDTNDTEDTEVAEGLEALVEGDLVITEILKNPCGLNDDPATEQAVECNEPQIADEAGEWFEIHNTTAAEVNLKGMRVSEADDSDPETEEESFVVDADLVVAAGGFVVLGVSDNQDLNGGVTVNYVYAHDAFKFGNGADSVVLENGSGIIDSVKYDGGETFHDAKGYSLNLNPATLDSNSNDNGANWCKASTMLPSGDYGTPGAANDICE